MGDADKELKDRNIELKDRNIHNCTKAAPAYGAGVAEALTLWHIFNFLFNTSLSRWTLFARDL